MTTKKEIKSLVNAVEQAKSEMRFFEMFSDDEGAFANEIDEKKWNDAFTKSCEAMKALANGIVEFSHGIIDYQTALRMAMYRRDDIKALVAA